MTLIFAGLFYLFNAAIVHPFHVSVCEIYHNDNTNSLEITLKIFVDDFELSIQKSGNANFLLSESDPQMVDKSQIKKYLDDHFNIKLNNKLLNLNFLGFEIQDEAILCYLEAEQIKNVNEIELTNSILAEIFDDQINLTHFQVKGQMKSVKTTKEKTMALVSFSD